MGIPYFLFRVLLSLAFAFSAGTQNISEARAESSAELAESPNLPMLPKLPEQGEELSSHPQEHSTQPNRSPASYHPVQKNPEAAPITPPAPIATPAPGAEGSQAPSPKNFPAVEPMTPSTAEPSNAPQAAATPTSSPTPAASLAPEPAPIATPSPPQPQPQTQTQPQTLTVPSDAAPSQGKKDFGLSGDWGGLRSRLDSQGVGVAVIYKGELSRVLSGGVEQKNSLLQNLDLRLLVDAEKLTGWKGTTFFLYAIGDWGASTGNKPSANVGDAQGTSNLETRTDSFKLYEAWAQKRFADDKASLLLGIHDLNSEFYVTDSSTLFLNASFGVGKDLSQSGSMGPSIFPYTTAAARLRVDPTSHFYIQSGIFNAQAADPATPSQSSYSISGSNGFLFVNEAAFVGPEDSPHKYGLGYWSYTRTFNHTTDMVTDSLGNSEARKTTSSGLYFLLDQPLSSHFSLFARYGTASPQSNQVQQNISTGLVGKGIITSRGEDKIGLGYTRVSSSTPGSPDESTYELSYRMEMGHGLALQPDLQLIQNPGFSSTINNTFVGAIRFELSL